MNSPGLPGKNQELARWLAPRLQAAAASVLCLGIALSLVASRHVEQQERSWLRLQFGLSAEAPAPALRRSLAAGVETTEALAGARAGTGAWQVLAVGLSCTALLAISLFHAAYRSTRISARVFSLEEDVERSRQIEAKLLKSKAKLAEAQRIACFGTWELDLVDSKLEWSDEIYRILELDPARYSPSYRLFCAVVHPEDRAALDNAYRDSVRTGTSGRMVCRLLMPDGRVKYIKERWETHYDDAGQPLRILGTTQDISERERAEERFRLAVEAAPNAVLMVDGEGRISLVNAQTERLFGYRREELMGKTVELLMPERFRHHHHGHRASFVGAPGARAMGAGRDLYGRHKDGSEVPIEIGLNPIELNGETAILASIIDITERKQAEEQLRLSAIVFESTTEGVVITDAQCNILEVNSAFSAITGYGREEVLGKTPRMFRSDRHDFAFYDTMWSSIKIAGCWQGEVWDRNKDGSVNPSWLNVSAVKDAAGKVTHYVGIFSDISAIKESQQQLDYLAHHDPLTGLPNRLLFHARLEHAVERSKREGHRVALLFVDLDHFKNINDTMGHPIGDALLQEAAQRLLGCVRKEDTVARLGGDEFTVILERVSAPEEARPVAQKILDRLSQAFAIAGHELYLSASIGISVCPEDGGEPTTLLQNADTAMYRAKQEGRSDYRYYSAELTAALQKRIALETDLRHALERDELILHYQPQFSLKDHRITGVEALVRWQHPTRGLISPAEFIPVAEESGLIRPLDNWVLRRACHQAKAWQAAGLPPLLLAVNISGNHINHDHVSETLKAVLDETGLDPALLEIEIIESHLLGDTQEVAAKLQGLKDLGVTLAIDDFGTGYSSLSYLKRLPVDRLKIDRSFVADVGGDGEAIVRAIIAIGAQPEPAHRRGRGGDGGAACVPGRRGVRGDSGLSLWPAAARRAVGRAVEQRLRRNR